jgi:hypothetical protein
LYRWLGWSQCRLVDVDTTSVRTHYVGILIGTLNVVWRRLRNSRWTNTIHYHRVRLRDRNGNGRGNKRWRIRCILNWRIYRTRVLCNKIYYISLCDISIGCTYRWLLYKITRLSSSYFIHRIWWHYLRTHLELAHSFAIYMFDLTKVHWWTRNCWRGVTVVKICSLEALYWRLITWILIIVKRLSLCICSINLRRLYLISSISVFNVFSSRNHNPRS